MQVIVIRDGKKLSKKANFIIEQYKSQNAKILYLFRSEENFFIRNNQQNRINLRTKLSGIFLYYTLFMILKSPKDLCEGLIRRIKRREPLSFIRHGGSLTVLSQAIYQRWVRRSEENCVFDYINKIRNPIIFVIDEFFSLRMLNIDRLKSHGQIVYISSDFAYDFYSDNSIASKMMYDFEKSLISKTDLIIACSERDKQKYEDLDINQVIFYPNLYPDSEFNVLNKDETPSVCLVIKEHWGNRSYESLNFVINSLSSIPKKIKLYLIGMKPKKIPSNLELLHYKFIPNKIDFLKILSKSWVGINLGIHFAGTNERKYDYAVSGLIVFSDIFGAKGDFIPNEYTYVDFYDLKAKLNQIFQLSKEEIFRKGLENRNYIINFAKNQKDILLKVIKTL